MRLPISTRIVAGGGAIAAIALAATIVPALAPGSSHREAPAISQDPTADNTDVYAFTSPDKPTTATLVANYIPMEEPAGGPNFYGFSDRARYAIKVDNTGDGQEDVEYSFRFRTRTVNPDTFLYATAPVTFDAATGTYKGLNVVQTYNVWRSTFKAGKRASIQLLGRDLVSPPNNVGPKSTPNYASALVPPAIHQVKRGTTVFAGQRDDPFFVDLGSTFDLVNIDKPGRPNIGLGNQGGGDDGLTGFNVHTIAIQVPKSDLTRRGNTPTAADKASPDSVIGVYASAERPTLVLGQRATSRAVKTAKAIGPTLRWTQVSRLGEPLINEVVIPLGKKDRWNRSDPSDDSQFLKHYTTPELAADINALFPGVINAPETNRQDLVALLLTGLPPGNPTGLVTQIGAGKPALADLLRLNLAIPPAAEPKRLGVLAGDAAGFPNGRRLADDVVDIEEEAVAGVVAPVFGLPAPTANAGKLGDGVDANDQDFLTTFPYVATPISGFDKKHPRPPTF